MHARRLRLVVAATVMAAVAVPLVPSVAQAHNCASARVIVAGTTHPVGSCHFPGDPNDICSSPVVWSSGYGAGATLCTDPPVANP